MLSTYRCWRCWCKRYEFTRWKKLWEDKGRCFFCLMDVLDAKYGPSLQAELVKQTKKNGEYRRPAVVTHMLIYKLTGIRWYV